MAMPEVNQRVAGVWLSKTSIFVRGWIYYFRNSLSPLLNFLATLIATLPSILCASLESRIAVLSWCSGAVSPKLAQQPPTSAANLHKTMNRTARHAGRVFGCYVLCFHQVSKSTTDRFVIDRSSVQV